MASVEREHVNLYNPLIDGADCNSATLLAAIAAIGIKPVVLVLTRTDRTKVDQVWQITTNMSIPEHITLYVPSGVRVNVAASVVLTVEGYVRSDEPVWWEGAGQVVLKKVRWRDERAFSDGFAPYVVSGGLHPTTAGMVSGAFATTAWLSGGSYLQENAAIDYDVLITGTDEYAWVCLSAGTAAAYGDWVRSGTSQYYVNSTTPLPSSAGLLSWTRPEPLPPDSLLLFGCKIVGGNIVRVDDYRHLVPWSLTTVNVMDYGAKGDGVTDDTEAFNRATGADEVWHPGLCRVVEIESGREFKVLGTVCIRAGQVLRGAGLGAGRITGNNATPGPMFALGTRREAGIPIADTPGSGPGISDTFTAIAPTIENIHVNIGPVPGAAIQTYLSGCFIRHCMLTNVDIGIIISSHDVLVSDILIDQALSGIYLAGALSVTVSDINMFLARRGIVFGGGGGVPGPDMADMLFNNILIDFPQYFGIMVQQWSWVKNVHFNNLIINMNEQFDTFQAGILIEGPGPLAGDMHFSQCHFRNLAGPALALDSGLGNVFTLDHWTVDGSKSRNDFAQSDTAAGIRIGTGPHLRMTNMIFSNLYGPVLQVLDGNTSGWEVTWDGGEVSNLIGMGSEPNAIVVNADAEPASTLALRNIDFGGYHAYNFDARCRIAVSNLTRWLGPMLQWGDGTRFVAVPWDINSAYIVSIAANPLAFGETYGYRKKSVYLVDVGNIFLGTAQVAHINATLLHKTFSGDTGVVPDLTPTFTLEGGGATLPGQHLFGRFFVNVPEIYGVYSVVVTPVGSGLFPNF